MASVRAFLPAVRGPYQGWAFYRATGIARLGHGVCGVVGTRSRANRVSTTDGRVRCSASNGGCVPARPALHVSTRLLPRLPSFLVRLRLPTPLHERAFRTTLHLLRTRRAGRAGTHRRSKALKPALPSGNLPAVRPGARPYQGWAFYRATGIARLGYGVCGVRFYCISVVNTVVSVRTLLFLQSLARRSRSPGGRGRNRREME